MFYTPRPYSLIQYISTFAVKFTAHQLDIGNWRHKQFGPFMGKIKTGLITVTPPVSGVMNFSWQLQLMFLTFCTKYVIKMNYVHKLYITQFMVSSLIKNKRQNFMWLGYVIMQPVAVTHYNINHWNCEFFVQHFVKVILNTLDICFFF